MLYFPLLPNIADLLSGHGFESHCGPFASNLEQVANLHVLRSPQPPTFHGTGNEE